MIRNYFLTALREIYKNKTFSTVHIFGLSLGIAAFVLILQYSLYELNYDNFYKNADQIYRVRQDRYDKGKLSTTWGAGCPAIGPALKNEFPEVLEYARLSKVSGIINITESNFREERMYTANTSFITMFPVKLLAGVDSICLNEPFTAIISESIAKKYFGPNDAIGQTFRLNKEVVFKITGVFKDIPENTHLKFNILISWPTYVKWRGKEIETAWFWDGFYTYVKLQKGTDIPAFERKMNEFTDKQIEDFSKQYNQGAVYSLQPLRSIHLHSNLMWEAEVNGDAKTVYFLMFIAFIILIIAWVNYINLSTVKAIFRSKEVGIRKISGAFRFQLIRQFLIESFTINLIASLVAMVIVFLCNPYLRTLTTSNLSIWSSDIWFVFLAVIFVGPVISGLYPSLIISSFSPMVIFRGKLKSSSGGSLLRKILVVFQFAASITLISVTITVYKQVIFMRNQELGVDIKQTLILKGPGVADSTYNEKLSVFKAELLKCPLIKAVTASTSIPGSKVEWNAGGIRLVSDDNSKSNQFRIIGVDHDFIEQYDLKILTGRNFSKDFSTDGESVIFNEEAVKLMGLTSPESALGKEIYFWGNNYKIIGVLKNFHQESLKEFFDALIFRFTPSTRDYFSVKLYLKSKAGSDTYTNETKKALALIKDSYNIQFPGNPFEYFYLTDHYENQYSAEKRVGTIFELFAILAIVIACLGLFGLSWFIIIQRTKEIGIRKANGASVFELLIHLSRDYFQLILIGLVLAAPLAYFFSIKWLEKYPNRVDFSWWLFLLSGLLIFLISAITISYNTISIAQSDPARSLRYE